MQPGAASVCSAQVDDAEVPKKQRKKETGLSGVSRWDHLQEFKLTLEVRRQNRAHV